MNSKYLEEITRKLQNDQTAKQIIIFRKETHKNMIN